jgi:hypothetical protein
LVEHFLARRNAIQVAEGKGFGSRGQLALIVVFFGGFAVGQVPGAPTGLYQRIAIITGWTWIAMVAWRELQMRQA